MILRPIGPVSKRGFIQARTIVISVPTGGFVLFRGSAPECTLGCGSG